MAEKQELSHTHCGFVAVIGAPNAGKSTLVNALVGSKVAIVSPKVQTTRMPVRGVAMRGVTQIVFLDTPGIFKPKRRLDRAMSGAAWTRAIEADLVVLVMDAERGIDHALDPVFANLSEVTCPIVAVLNKIDLVARPELLHLTAEVSKRHPCARTFMISALTGDGVAPERGHGANKRAAEQAAALAMLLREGVWQAPRHD